MANGADRELLDYVNRGINAGYRSIAIPLELVQPASSYAADEVRRLCRINEVKIEFVTD